MKMGKGISKSIWRTQREDYKSTGPLFTKKKGKIQSKNGCFGTCYKRSVISRVGWKMETDSFSVKNNASSRTKLRDLRQRTTSNSRSTHKVETISVGCSGTLRSLDGPQKPQIFQGATQAKWTASLMVFEVTRLWLHIKTHTGENKHKSGYIIAERPGQHKRGQ